MRMRTLISSALATAALAAPIVAVTAPADAAPARAWNRLAQCESGGRWHINTGNGYYGGLQINAAPWRGYGGRPLPPPPHPARPRGPPLRPHPEPGHQGPADPDRRADQAQPGLARLAGLLGPSRPPLSAPRHAGWSWVERAPLDEGDVLDRHWHTR